MLPDTANYRAFRLVIKHRDDQVCETRVDFTVTNVPPGKVADLVGCLDTLGRIPGSVKRGGWERAAGGNF